MEPKGERSSLWMGAIWEGRCLVWSARGEKGGQRQGWQSWWTGGNLWVWLHELVGDEVGDLVACCQLLRRLIGQRLS